MSSLDSPQANDTAADVLTMEQRRRLFLLKAVVPFCRAGGFASNSQADPVAMMMLSDWILNDGEYQGEPPIPPQAQGEAPMLSHQMSLLLTYDSPITDDTVSALVQVHEGDEGMVSVRGWLV